MLRIKVSVLLWYKYVKSLIPVIYKNNIQVEEKKNPLFLHL